MAGKPPGRVRMPVFVQRTQPVIEEKALHSFLRVICDRLFIPGDYRHTTHFPNELNLPTLTSDLQRPRA